MEASLGVRPLLLHLLLGLLLPLLPQLLISLMQMRQPFQPLADMPLAADFLLHLHLLQKRGIVPAHLVPELSRVPAVSVQDRDTAIVLLDDIEAGHIIHLFLDVGAEGVSEHLPARLPRHAESPLLRCLGQLIQDHHEPGGIQPQAIEPSALFYALPIGDPAVQDLLQVYLPVVLLIPHHRALELLVPGDIVADVPLHLVIILRNLPVPLPQQAENPPDRVVVAVRHDQAQHSGNDDAKSQHRHGVGPDERERGMQDVLRRGIDEREPVLAGIPDPDLIGDAVAADGLAVLPAHPLEHFRKPRLGGDVEVRADHPFGAVDQYLVMLFQLQVGSHLIHILVPDFHGNRHGRILIPAVQDAADDKVAPLRSFSRELYRVPVPSALQRLLPLLEGVAVIQRMEIIAFYPPGDGEHHFILRKIEIGRLQVGSHQHLAHIFVDLVFRPVVPHIRLGVGGNQLRILHTVDQLVRGPEFLVHLAGQLLQRHPPEALRLLFHVHDEHGRQPDADQHRQQQDIKRRPQQRHEHL